MELIELISKVKDRLKPHTEKIAGRGLVLVGIRGLNPEVPNQRSLYDDAIFLMSPSLFVQFKANVDPSVFRPGIATLKSGCWEYQVGTHGLSKPPSLRYEALVQAGKVTVKRDDKGDDTGYFGINIHRGGYNSTSSEGCQTIYPTLWDPFMGLLKSEVVRLKQTKIPYVLEDDLG